MDKFLLYLSLIFYILNLIISYESVLSNTCNSQSLKTKILPCDSENTTDVIVYSTEKCDIDDENKNLLHSKISGVSCDLECPKGTKMEYDFVKATMTCKVCPANTYSKGGNFVIDGEMNEWNENLFTTEKLVSNCYLIDVNGVIDSTKKCTGFSISADKSILSSGTTNEIGGFTYSARLFLGINLKKEGHIKFHYRKNVSNKIGFSNGQFMMYIDYNLELMEYDKDSSWKTFEKNLSSGYHDFLWEFNYLLNSSDKDMNKYLKLIIESIEISGVEHAALECLDCHNSVSTEGSAYCFSCAGNYYYEVNTKKCEQCPEGKFSFENSIGKDSCLEKKPCAADDYELISSNCEQKNNNGISTHVKTFSYKLIEPTFCDIDNPNSLKFIPDEFEDCGKCDDGFSLSSNNECQQCPLGSYSNTANNFKCSECPDGMYATTVFDLNKFTGVKENEFENVCVADEFKDCANRAWKFSRKEISAKAFPIESDSVDLVLKKNIKIIEEEGKIIFHYEINNLSPIEGYFLFLIDDQIYIDINDETENQSDSKYKNFQLILKKGHYTLTWKMMFYKKPVDYSVDNLPAVHINSLKIYGSDSGWSTACVNCKPGTIRRTKDDKDKSNYICKYCPFGTTSDSKNINCIACPVDQFSTEDKLCSPCPAFTKMNKNNICEPIDILDNREKLLRFNMNTIATDFNNKCKGSDENFSDFCYMNKFIGPIFDNSNASGNMIINNDMENKHIFFMSPFNSDKIVVSDYSYEIEKGDLSEGHIFALVERNDKKIPSLSFTSVVNQNHHMANLKKLKNVGSYIKKISLIEDEQSDSTNGKKLNNGIIIEYGGGDVCLNDKNQKYRSFLYLECNKEGGLDIPIFEMKQQNECVFIFKWANENACKNCVKSDTPSARSNCKNNTRTVAYRETANCLIFNGTQPAFSGFNQTFNETLYDPLKEPEMNSYFTNKYRQMRLLNEENELDRKNISDPYIEDEFEEEVCNILSSMGNSSLILIIVLPVSLYFLTVIIFWIICCKYRRAKKDYELLSSKDYYVTDQGKEESTSKKIDMITT